jgi:hypothetical protein
MDPTQAQSSFIPKKPTAGGISRSGGLIPYIANIIFVLALVASVLVFAYSKYLDNQISKMSESLTVARQALEPDLINQLASSDKRIIAGNELILNHKSLSGFFDLLESITLKNLRFTSFAYSPGTGGAATVTLKGQAQTYGALALQAKIFGQDENFINPMFSNLDLDDKGNVIFTFKSDLNPKAISYVSLLQGGTNSASQVQNVNVQNPGVATSTTKTN